MLLHFCHKYRFYAISVTIRVRSTGKVMFSVVCIILSTNLSEDALRMMQWDKPAFPGRTRQEELVSQKGPGQEGLDPPVSAGPSPASKWIMGWEWAVRAVGLRLKGLLVMGKHSSVEKHSVPLNSLTIICVADNHFPKY